MLITINRESKCNIRQVLTLTHGIVVKSESKHSSKIVGAKAVFVCFSRQVSLTVKNSSKQEKL
jgi:hypothetical protein